MGSICTRLAGRNESISLKFLYYTWSGIILTEDTPWSDKSTPNFKVSTHKKEKVIANKLITEKNGITKNNSKEKKN